MMYLVSVHRGICTELARVSLYGEGHYIALICYGFDVDLWYDHRFVRKQLRG